MPAMVDEIGALLDAGGWVSGPLIAVSLAMWFVATLRLLNIRRGFTGNVTQFVERFASTPRTHPHGAVARYLTAALTALSNPSTCQHHLERFLRVERERVADFGLLHMGLVTVAPLLGLLGTVTGMIETFASMEGLGLTHATEQTVAGGISVALVSTQLGLVIGVPGLAAARFLARREQRRSRELLQAHSVLIQLRRVQH